MKASDIQWPKCPPILSAEQIVAREKYMQLWHEQLPQKYHGIEVFNHGFAAKLPIKDQTKTLEIGAGLGEHAKYEDLSRQDYHCLEYREEFCKEIRKHFPADRVHCGDIQKRQPWPDKTFDRIVAIHVLEHLLDLPKALDEISRLLKDDGVLDIVIPCEGGIAHRTGRKLTAERLFKKHFKMDFAPIVKNEHVSTYREIIAVLLERFEFKNRSYFPFKAPIYWVNLAAGFRMVKSKNFHHS